MSASQSNPALGRLKAQLQTAGFTIGNVAVTLVGP